MHPTAITAGAVGGAAGAIAACDLRAALVGFTASTLRAANLDGGDDDADGADGSDFGSSAWGLIGGLADAKAALVEMLDLPTR